VYAGNGVGRSACGLLLVFWLYSGTVGKGSALFLVGGERGIQVFVRLGIGIGKGGRVWSRGMGGGFGSSCLHWLRWLWGGGKGGVEGKGDLWEEQVAGVVVVVAVAVVVTVGYEDGDRVGFRFF